MNVVGAESFAKQSQFSDPGSHAGDLARWPDGIAELMTEIQNLLIYDVVAEPFYGVRLEAARQADVHLRYARDILARARQINPAPLTELRQPAERVAARCRTFGLLLLAALRQRGVPARMRVGFATYFKPGFFEDHWVVQYWDADHNAWRYADPQFDAVWRQRLHIRHDVTNVPPDLFLTAAQAWLKCRAGEIAPDRVGISHVDMYGLFFIAGSLIRDLAAFNQVELLPWDVWGAQPAPYTDLSDNQLAYFDDIAGLLNEPEPDLAELRRRFETDEGLNVGTTVFNALLQKSETLVPREFSSQSALVRAVTGEME